MDRYIRRDHNCDFALSADPLQPRRQSRTGSSRSADDPALAEMDFSELRVRIRQFKSHRVNRFGPSTADFRERVFQTLTISIGTRCSAPVTELRIGSRRPCVMRCRWRRYGGRPRLTWNQWQQRPAHGACINMGVSLQPLALSGPGVRYAGGLAFRSSRMVGRRAIAVLTRFCLPSRVGQASPASFTASTHFSSEVSHDSSFG
jgi:hypothetical protein